MILSLYMLLSASLDTAITSDQETLWWVTTATLTSRYGQTNRWTFNPQTQLICPSAEFEA